GAIHRVERVRPRRHAECRVHDDDGSACWVLRAPAADRLRVVCCEAGAAGEADDGMPTAGGGTTAAVLRAGGATVGRTTLARPFATSWSACRGDTIKRSPRARVP